MDADNADTRTRGLLILPVCASFADYFQQHPEYAEVVHPSDRDAAGL
jgi:uncharacterized protein